MLNFRNSLWRAATLAGLTAAMVLGAAPNAEAKKKKAKAAPTKVVPAKPTEPIKPGEPTKAVEPAKAAAPALDVTDLWQGKCKACHGPDGTGKPPKTENMTAAAWQKRFTDAQIRKTIVEGFERDVDGVHQKMKAFPDLTPAQLDGLVAHVRGFAK